MNTNTTPRLPDVHVELLPFSIFGWVTRVTRAMRAAGHGDLCDDFIAVAPAGEYDELLAVCREWVNVS